LNLNKDLKELLKRSNASTSLTGNSCYESTVREGGKRHYVANHFYDWLESKPDSDYSLTVPIKDSKIYGSSTIEFSTEKFRHETFGIE